MQPMTDGIDDQIRTLVAGRLGIPLETVTSGTMVEIEIPPPGVRIQDPLLESLVRQFGTQIDHPANFVEQIKFLATDWLMAPLTGCLLMLCWDMIAGHFLTGGWGVAGLLILGGVAWLRWVMREPAWGDFSPRKRRFSVRRLVSIVRRGAA